MRQKPVQEGKGRMKKWKKGMRLPASSAAAMCREAQNIIKSIFRGLRPVVVGLIASAALLLMNGENFTDTTYSVAIAIVSFALTYFAKLHPILVIILAGLAGYIIY